MQNLFKMKRLKFDSEGFIDERQLENLEDSGCGDLTHFYGTSKSEKKVLAKLQKRIKEMGC